MKRLLSVLLIVFLIIPTIAVSVSAEETKTVSFSDIESTSAQGQAILKLATAGVLLGYPDGTFKPEQPITRGELSKVINKIFEYTEADAEVFPDVDKEKDWYYNEVAIAKKAGYIKGYEDGTFRGENNITREETCTILARVGGLYDLGISYPLKDAVSEWAVPYVNMAIIGGFMSTEEGDTFRATEKITRGEFCQAFEKFVQIKEEVTPPADDKKEENVNDNKGNNNTNNNSGNNNNNNSNSGNDEYYEEEEIDYNELNSETVAALNTALDELVAYTEIYSKEYEIKLVDISIKCINKVLPKAGEVEITDDYVEDICSSEIDEARKVWKSMSADDKNLFIKTGVPEFTFETVEWLKKFFGMDIPEI